MPPTYGEVPRCSATGLASYLWDSSLTWWAIMFILLGTAFMFPFVVVRPLLAIHAA